MFVQLSLLLVVLNAYAINSCPSNCNMDRDCGLHSLCVNGTCTTFPGNECNCSSNCPSGKLCRNGICLKAAGNTCTDKNECASFSCTYGYCGNDVLINDARACLNNTATGCNGVYGLQCARGYCRAPPGSNCRDNCDCVSDRCIDGTCGLKLDQQGCVADSDCKYNMKCYSGVCKGGRSFTCATNNDCYSYYCSYNLCFTPDVNKSCTLNSDCSYGFTCTTAGLCKYLNGFNCRTNSNCASNNCVLDSTGNGGVCNQ